MRELNTGTTAYRSSVDGNHVSAVFGKDTVVYSSPAFAVLR
jgi:hypothetical protein